MLVQRITTTDGDTLLYGGNYLYSSRYPRKKAVAAFPRSQKNTLYLIISPLLCYGLIDFYQNLYKSSAVILVEFTEALWNFSYSYYPHYLLRLKYLSKPDLYLLEDWLKEWEFLALNQLVVVYPSAGFSLKKETYKDFILQVQGIIEQHIHNQCLLKLMSMRWLKNFFHTICLPVFTYVSLPKTEVPVVVVGAGLTLEYHIRWLQKKSIYYYIVAVDTSLPVLKKYNIKPDVIIALESSPINLQDFIENKKFSDAVMLCDMSAHFQTARLHKGVTCFIQSTFSRASVFDRWQKIASMPRIIDYGSVGNTAIALALSLTVNQVILCGIDFAYQLGKSHAKGSYSHTLQLGCWRRTTGIPFFTDMLERNPRRVMGQKDFTVWSDDVLYSYARTLISTNSQRIVALSSPFSMYMGLSIWSDANDELIEKKTKLSWSIIEADKHKKYAFIQQEILYLQRFVEGDITLWPLLDYLFLGEFYDMEVAKTEQARYRAENFLLFWKELLA